MIRFDRRARVEFSQRFIVTALISQQTRAIVTDHDPLRRVHLQHSIQTAQRPLVIAVQTRHHRAHKMHAGVVGRFAPQLVGRRARLGLLAAR